LLEDRPVELKVDGSASFNHVTLSWNPPRSRLRPILEARLAAELQRYPTRQAAIGEWLLIISWILFSLFLGGLVLLILLTILRPA
jgi:hypothetical protein